jgi:hypothetical protein
MDKNSNKDIEQSQFRSRSKITGTFYWCLGGTFGFAGSLQSCGFAPHRQTQNFSPIPSV